ncbi:addiction module toxin RelE [Pasteurellaceae bacterium Macca]|nr:addiction module toxin RelE [Pasteurellaceae bacterium Macca]
MTNENNRYLNLDRLLQKHPDTEQPLKAWIAEVRKAQWQNVHEIKAQYRNASILKNRRVVFNIKGNDHRLIVAIAFKMGAVYIKFIGTHKEYDQINADTVEN